MHLVKLPRPRAPEADGGPAEVVCPACAKDGRHIVGTLIGTPGRYGQLRLCAAEDGGCERLYPEPAEGGTWWWELTYRLTGKRERHLARLRGSTCREAAMELRRRRPNAHLLEARWLNHAAEAALTETPTPR